MQERVQGGRMTRERELMLMNDRMMVCLKTLKRARPQLNLKHFFGRSSLKRERNN